MTTIFDVMLGKVFDTVVGLCFLLGCVLFVYDAILYTWT